MTNFYDFQKPGSKLKALFIPENQFTEKSKFNFHFCSPCNSSKKEIENRQQDGSFEDGEEVEQDVIEMPKDEAIAKAPAPV